MSVFKKIVFFALLLVSLSSVGAERVLFAHYTVEDGLSSNSVNSVCQDTAGFIWMATRYGVSRFDGVNFKNHNSSTDTAILKNDINYTFLLPNGKPTFSSSNAVLFSYNDKTGQFEDISSFLPDNKYNYDIKNFTIEHDGRGLLSTACGIYLFDKHNGQFKKVESDYNNNILDVCTDKFGRYWVGNYNGWLILDKNGQIMPQTVVKGGLVNDLFNLDNNHILICSTAGPMWLAELSNEADAPLLRKVNAPFNYVTAVVRDHNGYLWMGTLGDGLWKCRFNGKDFTYDKVVPLNAPEDALNKISSLFVDKAGNIWVPTQSSGVWRTTSVDGYAYVKSKDVGFPVAVGASFCATDDGNLLMGTDGLGLYLFDHHLQVKRSIAGLSSNCVLTIIKEGSDYLIGYWGGKTNRLNLKTGRLSTLNYNGITNPRFTTKNICRTDDGTLYVSVAGDGIYCGKGNKWERLVLTDSSMNNYPDLWLEGSCQKPDGTIRMYSARTIWSNRSGHFKPILPDADKSLLSNPLHVNHCVADADNYLYAATNKGLLVFDPNDANLGALTYVPNGEYASVIFDSNGMLWASGSNGILAIDTKHKTYQPVMPARALPSLDYFTGRACLLAETGNIFFGCKDGFVCVQPKVRANTQVEYMAFSQLRIHGEAVPTGSKLLPVPLKELDELKLAYSQNLFTLDFDLVDFSFTNRFIPKYRIPEIDTSWIELGNKRTIDVGFLPSGNFRIELAAFSGDKPAKIITLPVSVSPPWWQTGWFYALAVLFLLGLFFAFYRIRMRRLNAYRQELQQLVDERTADLNHANKRLAVQKTKIEEANQSLLASLKQKDQLVAVVAHDLKNPMFAIVSALRRLLTNVYAPAEQHRLLVKIADESEKLQSQMVNLLQWANGEATLSAFHPTAVDANILVEEAISLLKGLADEKEIALSQTGHIKFKTFADARMFSTIIRNLLTNAIKFTRKGGRVSVNVEENDNETVIKVVDQGVGMSPETTARLLSGSNVASTSGTEQEQGFGFGFKIVLDYIKKNRGNLHIDSTEGKGTTVEVVLPRCEEEVIDPVKKTTSVGVSINKELLSGKTILVVDDDELILDHIGSLLSPFVEVLKAHDGAEGYAMAQAHVPDLVISDVDMPNLDGLEMYTKMGTNLLTSNIPLLFLSAKTDNSVKLKGLSIGAIDYIAKPFADDELLVKICNFLLWQQKLQLKALTKTYGGEETTSTDAVNPLLEKIISLVKENYSNPLYSLTDFVRELGMSKATLSRRLKSITDKTPIEILNEYRLNMSKKLLEEGQMSVSDVAYAVGFNDPSYFSRRFKECFGNTPKSVR
ncbi:MAG: response regulator [Paludibacteraceae bacterium]|nr:response regulator [Paludibacteraceae bacterium]